MEVAKWFKVLVIGGASMLTVACGDMPRESNNGSTPPPNNGNDSDAGNMHGVHSDASVSMDAARAQDSGTSPDAGGAPDGSVTAADATAAAVDSGMMPMCSMTPNPADACGCPCCWAVGFLNTDPECASFCNLGNNGMGCCE